MRMVRATMWGILVAPWRFCFEYNCVRPLVTLYKVRVDMGLSRKSTCEWKVFLVYQTENDRAQRLMWKIIAKFVTSHVRMFFCVVWEICWLGYGINMLHLNLWYVPLLACVFNSILCNICHTEFTVQSFCATLIIPISEGRADSEWEISAGGTKFL